MSGLATDRVADYIDRAGHLAPLSREHAGGSEARAQLSPEVAKAFREAGLLREFAAGLSSLQTSCPIERCWRDLHPVTQHMAVSNGRYETVGRILPGLQPGPGVI